MTHLHHILRQIYVSAGCRVHAGGLHSAVMSGLQVLLHLNLSVNQANLMEILVNSYKSDLPAVLPFISERIPWS